MATPGLPSGSAGLGVPGIDLTADQLERADSLDKAAKEIGIASQVYAAVDNAIGGATSFRDIALIPRASWDRAIAAARVGENPLPVVSVARLEVLWRTARIKVGLTPGEAPPSPPAVEPYTGATPGTASADTSRKLKLSSLIDRTLDADLVPLPGVTVRQMFTDYEAVRGGEPDEDIEPTAAQLSGLKQLLESDAPPYVDFSIFGPHGRRMLEKLIYIAFVLLPDGNWQRQELPGPPNIDVWWAAWRVFRTTMLLLKQADTEPLDNYGEFIRRLALSYPEAWFLVYTGDVRMRAERFERIRRAVETKDAKDKAAGQPSSYDPRRPWNAVFREAVKDKDFWDETVRYPAMLYLAHVRSVAQSVDDGTVQPNLGNGGTRPRQVGTEVSEPPAKRARQQSSAPPQDLSEKVNGKYVKNRKGKALCPDYQTGTCGHSNPCPNGVHQCNVCLQTHRPSFHENSGGQRGSRPGKGKGKGKGDKGRR